jgi:hypothetical protein
MVSSIEQIERDIAVLDKAIAELTQELYDSYNRYLNLLAPVVRQQLILSSYHLCTQGYPEQFLALPYGQRQQLQQTLRQLAEQTQEEILAQLHPPIVPETTSPTLPVAAAQPTELVPEVSFSDQMLAQTTPFHLTPVHLAQWHQDLEQAIVQELQTASHAANRVLQQAGILPQKLPEPILEVASKADAAAIGNTPNLTNLLVETPSESTDDDDSDDDSRDHRVIQLTAIHLRLVEIEFADPGVTAARSRIRSLLARLKTLGRDYKKKQRERSIAEAQTAWRASWTEEGRRGKDEG